MGATAPPGIIPHGRADCDCASAGWLISLGSGRGPSGTVGVKSVSLVALALASAEATDGDKVPLAPSPPGLKLPLSPATSIGSMTVLDSKKRAHASGVLSSNSLMGRGGGPLFPRHGSNWTTVDGAEDGVGGVLICIGVKLAVAPANRGGWRAMAPSNVRMEKEWMGSRGGLTALEA